MALEARCLMSPNEPPGETLDARRAIANVFLLADRYEKRGASEASPEAPPKTRPEWAYVARMLAAKSGRIAGLRRRLRLRWGALKAAARDRRWETLYKAQYWIRHADSL